ncbi:McrB family protein [Capnocytophaga cynodegmi]|uniref:McrB family protein n=1 Tax=Capnocytophaga cynodegmi TaxID=28189 RepID=UPI002936DB25|nr:AAA family ATPase [Capnocytophaga cynodegmi]
MEKIIKGLEIWENWKEDYKKFVPRFIEEAKTKSRWQDWDKDVFYEYFERSKGQCVSSLKQGYFSNKEKEEIKQNWETEIAPILKEIAESQETLRINLYGNLDNIIRQHTSQHRKAAVNRLIAGLQPKILCTIVNPKDLNKAKNLINNLLPKDKKIKDKDYFEISNKVIELIKKIYPNDNIYDLVTIPWQLYETLSNKQIVENKEDMNLEKTLNLLKYKKQIILQGPPGTGKTREAKELAKALLKLKKEEDLKNNDQFQIIQFHPSYSYEDFVRGIVAKPNSNGDGITYEAENKVLTEFAENAEKDSNNNYVLIIDEINRANLSSVLGELIYALEYHGEAVDSMYAVDRSNKITLPPNLYIIGTMNTADRSVGHIDYAIRRRFAFVDMFPKDLSQELGEHFAKDKFIAVSELFIKDFDLNKDYSKEQIVKSEHLSSEFDAKDVWLGHSYFITKDIDIQTRLNYEIKPILREYVKDGVLKELAINEINKL